METATLDLNALKAANCAVSTEKTRYYLNGVLVEITAKAVIYVATDGQILFGHRQESLEENTLVGNFIIPRETIAGIKVPKNFSWTALQRLATSVGHQLALAFNGNVLGFTPIDGTFPDWRRIVSSRTTGSSNHGFNPNLLAKLWKAGGILNLTKEPDLSLNGDGPAMVLYGDERTFGLIMPRGGGGPRNAADWIHQKPHLSQAA